MVAVIFGGLHPQQPSNSDTYACSESVINSPAKNWVIESTHAAGTARLAVLDSRPTGEAIDHNRLSSMCHQGAMACAWTKHSVTAVCKANSMCNNCTPGRGHEGAGDGGWGGGGVCVGEQRLTS